MTRQPTDIEAEVIEIDGVVPQPRGPADAPPRGDWHDWRNWSGQVRRLDSRWWPLWLVLGIIALGLMLTVGMVLGVVVLVVRLVLKAVRAILP